MIRCQLKANQILHVGETGGIALLLVHIDGRQNLRKADMGRGGHNAFSGIR